LPTRSLFRCERLSEKNDSDGHLYIVRGSAADNAGNARSAEATVEERFFRPPLSRTFR
jgi:hypothetical protein